MLSNDLTTLYNVILLCIYFMEYFIITCQTDYFFSADETTSYDHHRLYSNIWTLMVVLFVFFAIIITTF